jgi:hypothetical protein
MALFPSVRRIGAFGAFGGVYESVRRLLTSPAAELREVRTPA